jgi:ABC-2 type transport system permease protein
MRSTISLYRRLIDIQIRSQLQYPVAFWFDLLATGLITALAFTSLALVLQRFEHIGGWSLAEIAFLYGMVETAFGVMDMLFSGFDPPYFGQRVRRGTFDQMLLRPASILVQVLGSRFVLRRLGRIAQGAAILGLGLALAEVQWTPGKVLYLPVVFASLVSFFAGLFIVGSTITFWTVESIEVVNIFTYGGSEMMAYPMHIYPQALRRVFTYVVPAIFLNYCPALYILDKPDPLGLPSYVRFLAPVAGVGVLLVGWLFWQVGLRAYQSTGT